MKDLFRFIAINTQHRQSVTDCKIVHIKQAVEQAMDFHETLTNKTFFCDANTTITKKLLITKL